MAQVLISLSQSILHELSYWSDVESGEIIIPFQDKKRAKWAMENDIEPYLKKKDHLFTISLHHVKEGKEYYDVIIRLTNED